MFNKKLLCSDLKKEKRIKGMFLFVGVFFLIGALFTILNFKEQPKPKKINVKNPIIVVDSQEQMNQYLDFSVPVLEKEVETFSVIVVDDYPTIGQIDYLDGSEYRVQYGTGDISGIYDGILLDTQRINDVDVKFYLFSGVDSEVTYAIWEDSGYTFSYVYTNNEKNDIENLIHSFL